MYNFENSIYFWYLLLLIPLYLLFIHLLKWKKHTAKSIGDIALVNRLTINYNHTTFKLKVILLLTVIFLGVVAAINFRKDVTQNSQTNTMSNRQGIDIIVALDISKSMLAQDVKPTRLEQAKILINKLLDNLGNNRVGCVVFAGQAILQMPITDDLGAARMLIANLQPDMIPIQGTEIGTALLLSNKALGNISEKKYKAIILITDGEDHDNSTSSAVKQLKEAGVVVYTVGIGSTSGTPIFDPSTNDYVKEESGETVLSKLNEDGLKNIAKETQGAYFHLDNHFDAANNIAKNIDSMEKKLIQSPLLGARQYLSSFPYLIGLMLLLLMVDIFLKERKKNVR